MDESIIRPLRTEDGAFELGEILGGRRAFSTVAGRCSAADAACLKRMRDKKMYRVKAESWGEFCPKYLGMSKTHANRIIHQLEEFGPEYFELTQLTRISPEQYRMIAPSVREHAFHSNGEAIALIPENAEKIATALEELRKSAKPQPRPTEIRPSKRPASRRSRIALLRETAHQLTAEFADLARTSPSRRDIPVLADIRNTTLADLYAVDLLR
jgi:hypothetical protein